VAQDEAVFAELARWLDAGRAGVLAQVVATRGAVPRRTGSRMLVGSRRCVFSVGGGALEGRVIAAARQMLRDGVDRARMSVDLGGGADAAGVCGGRVELELWRIGALDADALRAVAARLAAGRTVALARGALIADGTALSLRPNPLLLIVGAGHCGRALYRLARDLDLAVRVADPDSRQFAGSGIAAAARRLLPFAELGRLVEGDRAVHAVLLNRDYAADVASLSALFAAEAATGRPFAYLGMMGSRRRIATVRRALPAFAERFATLDAPIGIEIGAETPAEIAVSIAAKLIAVLSAADAVAGTAAARESGVASVGQERATGRRDQRQGQ
jgi:xanthine dehydrogenase accessory factor